MNLKEVFYHQIVSYEKKFTTIHTLSSQFKELSISYKLTAKSHPTFIPTTIEVTNPSFGKSETSSSVKSNKIVPASLFPMQDTTENVLSHENKTESSGPKETEPPNGTNYSAITKSTISQSIHNVISSLIPSLIKTKTSTPGSTTSMKVNSTFKTDATRQPSSQSRNDLVHLKSTKGVTTSHFTDALITESDVVSNNLQSTTRSLIKNTAASTKSTSLTTTASVNATTRRISITDNSTYTLTTETSLNETKPKGLSNDSPLLGNDFEPTSISLASKRNNRTTSSVTNQLSDLRTIEAPMIPSSTSASSSFERLSSYNTQMTTTKFSGSNTKHLVSNSTDNDAIFPNGSAQTNHGSIDSEQFTTLAKELLSTAIENVSNTAIQQSTTSAESSKTFENGLKEATKSKLTIKPTISTLVHTSSVLITTSSLSNGINAKNPNFNPQQRKSTTTEVSIPSTKTQGLPASLRATHKNSPARSTSKIAPSSNKKNVVSRKYPGIREKASTVDLLLTTPKRITFLSSLFSYHFSNRN